MTVEHPSNETQNGADVVERHPTYWQEDGTLVIQVQRTLFRLSADLLFRHSPVVSKGVGPDGGSTEYSYVLTQEAFDNESTAEGKDYRAIRTTEQVQSKDFEVLLQTLLDE
jgi:hypothetical protein